MQLHEVVAADVLDYAPASGRQAAVGERHANADQEIARRAIAQAQWTGPAGGEQAADRVTRRVERVEGEELAALAKLSLERLERDAGFDADHHVGLRALEHAIELGRANLDAVSRCRVSHLGGSATADWENRMTCLRRFVQQPCHLFGRGWFFDGPTGHYRFASTARPVRPARCGRLCSGSGKILPGFMIPAPSSAPFTRHIASRSSGL